MKPKVEKYVIKCPGCKNQLYKESMQEMFYIKEGKRIDVIRCKICQTWDKADKFIKKVK